MLTEKIKKKHIFFVLFGICNVFLLILHFNLWKSGITTFDLGCHGFHSSPPQNLLPKHTNIVFLKTHKTGSSTMQNLLFRFAERHNLTVALPVEYCGHLFCYPSLFNSKFVHQHTVPPNIIASHLRFNKKELQRLMPKDSVYITILREPGSMFESSFIYFNQLSQSFRKVPKSSLETFLDDPLRYYQPSEQYSMCAHNMLTFDLGGEKDRASTDAAYADAFVAEVEKTFSLVMITEYFDESLILLRHLLSWDLDDILYLELNMRSPSSKQSLTSELTEKVRTWNSLDARLYDHFNASLWRQLYALGPACVEMEIQTLRQARENLMKSCFGEEMPSLRSAAEIKNKRLRPWQPDGKGMIMGYDLPEHLPDSTRQLCLKLVMPENQYTNALLNSQSQRYKLRVSTQQP
ncbi:galactose-3-O-sulfotransferase 3-like [Cynoglossus semilaevis]|uniref:Galactose-3-O-sulfotransferase 3 n=1 Tax=Cynoglossus semilaevis TaxID=244447 RepID=A0A3P8V518_CYNSE|nr:galactose-3-O-sulfotransferase 3-like [Cynoglossus semilaevis]